MPLLLMVLAFLFAAVNDQIHFTYFVITSATKVLTPEFVPLVVFIALSITEFITGTNWGMGSRLSGGQKQRIGIARALYKDAEVLFFDEATSALDSHTEQEINAALQELSDTHKELTMIIIAHRESSLTFCDRIIDLKE